MAYLLCEKCGKRYELKKGKPLNESDLCECGGKFRYVQNFGAHFDEELDPINEFNICPDCGKILEDEFCKECGFKPKKSKKPKKNQDIKK
jgi:hypothetical protein